MVIKKRKNFLPVFEPVTFCMLAPCYKHCALRIPLKMIAEQTQEHQAWESLRKELLF